MSRNLDGAANSALMSLRLGSHRNAAMQAAWKAHGEASFVYAVVEMLEEDLSPIGKEDWLKARLRHWIAALEARAIVA